MVRATGYEDRGQNPAKGKGEPHYGFVYFNDDRRVIYTNERVGPGTGGWEPITPTHIKIATEVLKNAGMIDLAYED